MHAMETVVRSLMGACASWSLPATVLALHYRRQIRLRELADAEATQAALLGSVRVDGIELPLPSDERWTAAERTRSDSVHVSVLQIEPVVIAEIPRRALWIGTTLHAAPSTPGIKRYISDVFTAYRNRIARKAING